MNFLVFIRSSCCVVLLAMFCASCAQSVKGHRGYVFKDDRSAIYNGQTKGGVITALGSPSMVSGFDPNIWYYIGLENTGYAGQMPRRMQGKVLELHLDADYGTVNSFFWREFEENLSYVNYVDPRDLRSYQWRAILERAASSLKPTPIPTS